MAKSKEDKKKPLTADEKLEAARLKAIYSAKSKSLGLTQESLGARLSVTQGMITQWFNGLTRIGDLALFKLAFHLEVEPDEIRPNFSKQHPELSGIQSIEREPTEYELAFNGLSEDRQKALLSLLQALQDE